MTSTGSRNPPATDSERDRQADLAPAANSSPTRRSSEKPARPPPLARPSAFGPPHPTRDNAPPKAPVPENQQEGPSEPVAPPSPPAPRTRGWLSPLVLPDTWRTLDDDDSLVFRAESSDMLPPSLAGTSHGLSTLPPPARRILPLSRPQRWSPLGLAAFTIMLAAGALCVLRYVELLDAPHGQAHGAKGPEAAVASFRADPAAAFTFAQQELRRGSLLEAHNWVERALSAQPHNPTFIALHAEILLRMSQRDESRQPASARHAQPATSH